MRILKINEVIKRLNCACQIAVCLVRVIHWAGLVRRGNMVGGDVADRNGLRNVETSDATCVVNAR